MGYKDPNLIKPTGEKDSHGFPVDSCSYCRDGLYDGLADRVKKVAEEV